MSAAAAARMRRLRERQASGQVTLRIQLDEVQLLETLAAARLIDRMSELCATTSSAPWSA